MAPPEEGEREGEEFGGVTQDGPRTTADAAGDQAVGDPVGKPVQFPEAQASILAGEDYGRGVRLPERHIREMGGDIHKVCALHIAAHNADLRKRSQERKPARILYAGE
jgi:hypothetical protein